MAPIRCLVYIGLPDNPQFVGPQEPQKLAEHIARSHGPSGGNDEYLFMLETALRSLSPESNDAHILDLSERVRRIEEARSKPRVANDAISKELRRVASDRSGHAQEETDG